MFRKLHDILMLTVSLKQAMMPRTAATLYIRTSSGQLAPRSDQGLVESGPMLILDMNNF